MAALPDERFQLPAQRGKVGQLPLYVRQMFAGDGVHSSARSLLMVGQIEQRPDLLNGKAELAGASMAAE